VLLPQIANWNQLSLAVLNRNAEQFLAHENSFSVMPQRAVTEVGDKRFRLIKPIVNCKIIFCLSAEFSRAILCVFKRVRHN
jgi:hypothetical protein